MVDHLAIIRELDYLAVKTEKCIHRFSIGRRIRRREHIDRSATRNRLTFKHVRVTEISIFYLNVIRLPVTCARLCI